MSLGLLLSGGMDSVALAYWKKPQFAFTVDYGQLPALGEVRAAKQVCSSLGIEHILVSIDCSSLGSGDLIGAAADSHAPATDWWPYRNQLLITLVATKAISLGVKELLIGTVKTDAIHSDGSLLFLQTIDKLMSIQEGWIRVNAPAINLTCAELVQQSGIPLDLLSWAHSCHTSEFACGRCRGCNKHRETMSQLGYESY